MHGMSAWITAERMPGCPAHRLLSGAHSIPRSEQTCALLISLMVRIRESNTGSFFMRYDSLAMKASLDGSSSTWEPDMRYPTETSSLSAISMSLFIGGMKPRDLAELRYERVQPMSCDMRPIDMPLLCKSTDIRFHIAFILAASSSVCSFFTEMILVALVAKSQLTEVFSGIMVA